MSLTVLAKTHKYYNYFEAVAKKTRELDSTRPITFACDNDFSSDLVTQYMDVVMINCYYGWYSDSGHPEVVPYQLSSYDFRQLVPSEKEAYYDIRAWCWNY